VTVPIAGTEADLIAEDWAHQLVDGVDMIEPDQVPEFVPIFDSILRSTRILRS
tara:strand:- start:72 stop:230 length:159 start_codon:yes stop_codon:yes gene_type:complete